jgi:serine protease
MRFFLTAPWRPMTIALAVAGLCGPAAAQTVNSTVTSLLVELRDAPSHVALAKERDVAARQSSKSTVAELQQLRWKAVEQHLASTPAGGLQKSGAAPVRVQRRDPVGERAQVLRFAQALPLDQAQALAQQLMQRSDVAWATPNSREPRAQASSAPTDSNFPGPQGQWWLQPVQGSNTADLPSRLRGVPGFQTAWASVTTGSVSPTVVAVLDSGITPHPELQGRLLPGYDFVSDSVHANDGDGRDADPTDPGDWVSAQDRSSDPARFGDCAISDSSWHGTIIAGQIAAQTNNEAGVAAMNWGARVLPVRVSGKCGADVSDIIDALRWASGLPACQVSDGQGQCTKFAVANPYPARIVNLSFGGTGGCEPYNAVIEELRLRGTLVVASAGNRRAEPSRPAKCAGVVGVTALNRDGFKAGYASFGSALSASGLATVGGDDPEGSWGSLADDGLLTLSNGGYETPGAAVYGRHFGTSFAAPLVAGTASLMLSANPQLSVAELIHGLRVSARHHVTSPVPGVLACSADNPGRCLCTTQTCGAGILDATQALLYARSPASYVPPPSQPVSIDTPELRAVAAQGPDQVSADLAQTPAGQATLDGTGGGGLSAVFLLLLCGAAAGLQRRR